MLKATEHASDAHRLFEYEGHWLARRPDTNALYIYWYDQRAASTCRQSTRTHDLEEAKRRLIAYVHHKLRPRDQREEDVPLAEVLAFYLETRGPKLAKSSQDTANYAVRRLLKHTEAHGILYVSEFRWEQQQAYMLELEQMDGLADGTISRHMSVIRAAFNWYHTRGFMRSAPKVQLRPAAPPRERFLTPEEARRLLDACQHDHLWLFIMIALHTLARPGAILDLTLDQIDFESNRINFLKPGMRQTTKRKPVVPITATLRPHLLKAVRGSQAGHVVEFMGCPIRSIRKGFRTACDHAGLGPDVVPYTLRHTGATWLASNGVDLRTISGMLGHTQQRTTEIYAKHHPQFLRPASEAMEKVFQNQVIAANSKRNNQA